MVSAKGVNSMIKPLHKFVLIKKEEKENKVYKFIFTYSTFIYFSSSCNLDNWLFYKDYGFRRRKYRTSN